jgi:hypothetical protein
MRQSSEMRAELPFLSERVDEAGGKIEPFDGPTVFAHVPDEIAGSTAEVEQPSGSSKRDPPLASSSPSNDDACQRRKDRGSRIRGLRRISKALTQEGAFQPSPPAPARMLARLSFPMRRVVLGIKRTKTAGNGPGIGKGQAASAATNDLKSSANVGQSVGGEDDCFLLMPAAKRTIHTLQFN